MFLKKYDKVLAVIFTILSLLFLLITITNSGFLDWIFTRHQNQLSWYIRPLFLIPFCFFAFKKSWAGISITIFCIFTSMFWFPEPQLVSKQVEQFLQYEVDYLNGNWNLTKSIMALLVPLSLSVLGMAFWKRNLWIGLSVIILIAMGKILWSVLFAGESGKSVIIPAISGLLICAGVIFLIFKKISKKEENNIVKK